MAETKDYIFSLDIGTRSIIGMVGAKRQDKLCIVAVAKEEHNGRAMVDGQIEDIGQVARVAAGVKQSLEEQTGLRLDRVHVAAAGRALKTQRVSYELELPEAQIITEEVIKNLESGAIEKAEDAFEAEFGENEDKQFFLVGYSVCQYLLDNYPISSLLNHKGKRISAEIIATFLPGEVVESLYTSMREAGMEVASMTLEPIASMNAAIPQNLRLLNLALVDIGAGTSDIAAARDGSICGYTMATVAGDEVTESLMKAYLIDFDTAESLKFRMGGKEDLTYTDVLGFEHTVSSKEVYETAEPSIQLLCRQIADKVMDINGAVPSAVFLVGGGSKMANVREYVAQYLDMDLNRVALGGNNFSIHAYSDDYEIKDPEYSTPLGIAVSAALNLINDSFYIYLNGERAKLFRSGRLTIRDVLMMNGYGFRDMISRSGKSLAVELDGERVTVKGDYAVPAALTLNGEPASISDTVHAGDQIGFEPAQDGRDASAYVGAVVSVTKGKRVFYHDTELPIGVMAAVNGVPAEATTPLHNGDKIETLRLLTAGDVAGHYEIRGRLAVNHMEVAPDWPLEDGDLIDTVEYLEEQSKARREQREAEAAGEAEQAGAAELLEPEPPYAGADAQGRVQLHAGASSHEAAGSGAGADARETGQPRSQAVPSGQMQLHFQPAAPSRPQTASAPADGAISKGKAAGRSASTATAGGQETSGRQQTAGGQQTGGAAARSGTGPGRGQKAGNGMQLTLNNKKLRLEPKKSGLPYYMMDILIYADIDLENPKGTVELKINGKDAGFQTELKNGDAVAIYWKDES